MPIVMLGFLSFIIWYTAYRLHAHFKFISFLKFLIITIIGLIGSLLLSAITLNFSNPFAGILSIMGGYIFLFSLYSFFSLLIIHIIRLIWKPSLVWSGISALAIAFIAVFIGAIIASSFIVSETEVKIPKLKKELTLMHISDVHIGHHRGKNYLAKIVEKTNKLNPDLILITGDFIDVETSLRPDALEPLSNFKAPVYFAEGNHEKHFGAERVLKLIGEHNVRILRNEVIETHGIQLIGINYINMHGSDYTGVVKEVLKELPLKSDIPSVLISHSPVGVRYFEEAGIDLMLAGHLHGGQFFPMFPLSKLTFPFVRGLYQHGNIKVFVSSGAGTSFMTRVRLGSFNEICLLKLVPAN
ncbi:MAG: metallophosphoesterase [Spirochaetaceae bacterium]|nr:metallophosphoesterase [Spirochaetaceae bacterium]